MKKNLNQRKILKKYFSFAMKYKWMFFSMLLAAIVMETLYIADKFLYKRAISVSENFISGAIGKVEIIYSLKIILFLFIGLFIGRAFMRWLSGFLLASLEPKMIYDLKNKYFNHILKLHYRFHSEHKTGALISKLGRGARAIENITDVIVFQFSPMIIQFILVSISIALFSIKSAIILLVIMAAFIGYSLRLTKIQAKLRLKLNETTDVESGSVSDVFTNIESVKYYGNENGVIRFLRKLFKNTKHDSIKAWRVFSYMEAGQSVILGLGVVAMLYFPFIDFINGKMDLSTIVFIYSLYGSMSSVLFRFVYGIKSYFMSIADLDGLIKYGEMENEIKDVPGAKNIKIENGEIEFRNVCFKYKNGKKVF